VLWTSNWLFSIRHLYYSDWVWYLYRTSE